MKKFKFAIPSILLLIFCLLLNNGIGGIPPLGKLLNPFTGFWENLPKKGSSEQEFQIPGLKEAVSIFYDENGVPHIFAKNDEDLYFAQGYIMAKDRLWQMEFYTLAAGGRISEIVGEKALDLDKYNRRLGLANAAKAITNNLEKDPLSKLILNSYSEGVNSYISTLAEKELPLEYKILNYKPEKWNPEKCILMMMNMRKTLSLRSYDAKLTEYVQKYGMTEIEKLFSDYPEEESPIIPVGTKWNFKPLPIPEAPKDIIASSSEKLSLNWEWSDNNLGSNNWAISGSKSATGLPILANDPHLNLTLPSIWYQMQLVSPSVNVYGVCLPGAPGVIIGFNKDVAWGVTNVGSDVMDFYQIKFKDKSKKEYWYNNKWNPVNIRVEEIKIKGKATVLDTVLLTHHGPIVFNENKDGKIEHQEPEMHAMRWGALETDGSDLLTFYLLNRAKNYDDYREALLHFTAPAQNFIFASNGNDIAITPNGKFPLKWKEQGKFIMDGSDPKNDWQGWIPKEQNPTVKNPPRGFVSSANQFSTDPTYPYYLDWTYAPPFRGMRINERLAVMQNATIDSLRSLQDDVFNIPARMLMPILLKNLQGKKNEKEFQILSKWDYQNRSNSIAPSLFEEIYNNLYEDIWEDDFPDEYQRLFPNEINTIKLIQKTTDSPWYDDKTTKDKKETLSDLINRAYDEAKVNLANNFGPENDQNWAWFKVKGTKVQHLVPNFKAFGTSELPVGGGSRMVNATTQTTGPSWRMVVQLDKEWPKAYGLYPGGQSGAVGDKHYDDLIGKWTKGELNELLFMKNQDQKTEKIKRKITLKP